MGKHYPNGYDRGGGSYLIENLIKTQAQLVLTKMRYSARGKNVNDGGYSVHSPYVGGEYSLTK